jgi:hypothetical protein
MSNKLKLINFSESVKDIFQETDIVGLGETAHGEHLDIFKELNKLSKKLKNCLSGIFLELPNNLQPSVNYYLKTAKFDKNLSNLLKGATKEGKDFKKMYSYIFNFARKLDIPVICTDSSKKPNKDYKNKYPQNPSWYLKGKSRDEDMFNIIKNHYSQKKNKWFFIAHLGHAGYEITYDNHVPAGSLLKKEFKGKYCCFGLINKRVKTSGYDRLEPTQKMADAFLYTKKGSHKLMEEK